MRAFQGPPRPSQHHCCTSIINGNVGPTMIPRCDLRWIWVHEFENSMPTSNTLVCARKRCTKREFSLVVGVANISWAVISQLALTAWRQHTKNQVPNSTYVGMTTCCLLGAGTYVPSESSQKVSPIFKRNRPQEISRKHKKNVLTSTYTVKNVGSFQETSPKGLFCYVS